MAKAANASRGSEASKNLKATAEMTSWPSEPVGFSTKTIMGLVTALAVCAALYVTFLAGLAYRIPLFEVGEAGLLELSQDCLLGACVVVAGVALLRAKAIPLKLWLGAIFAVLFYLFGEEISWGQHLIGWQTEGWFAANNYQNETNFHNTDSWYTNELPRKIMIAGALLFGGIYPLLRRIVRKDPKGIPHWLMPRINSAVPALFIAVPVVVERLPVLSALSFDTGIFQMSELAEFYLYAFFLMYLEVLNYNLKRAQANV